jgi:hypothetical protein
MFILAIGIMDDLYKFFGFKWLDSFWVLIIAFIIATIVLLIAIELIFLMTSSLKKIKDKE